MTLNNTDVFVVQRQTGGKAHYKTSISDLVTHVSSQPVLVYRGLIDLTAAPAGQLNPSPPLVGDVYLNSQDGVLADGYTGLTAGIAVTVDDRLVFNGSAWEHIPQSSGSANGVVSISGVDPISVNNDNPANPIISLEGIDGGEYAT